MRKLFYPESVAVIGASPKPSNIAANIVENLKNWGFSGSVYPVNPSGGEIFGLKIYKAVSEIPERIDLAVAFVPAGVVPSVMDECGRAGIKRMAIPSGGFSELGKSGEDLSGIVMRKAELYGIKFVGPNALTIINAENGLCLPFANLRKREPGNVSLITQSGGVGLAVLMYLEEEGLFLNKFASIGNKLDLDEVDFLKYFMEDEGTEIICCYLESIQRGREFLELCAASKKPVLLYKSGIEVSGIEAAKSHTSAMAVNDEILDGAVRQAGILRVKEVRNLATIGKAFNLPPVRGNGVAVVSPMGGFTVIAGDLCEKAGFTFPVFPERVIEKISGFLHSGVIRIRNPLDMGDIYDSGAILEIIKDLLSLNETDAVLLVMLRRPDSKFTGSFSALASEIYGEIKDLMKTLQKAVFVCIISSFDYAISVKERFKLPVFSSLEIAVEAMRVSREHFSRTADH